MDTLEALGKLIVAGIVLQTYGAILIIGTFSIVAGAAGTFLFVYYKIKRRFLERLSSSA
ncbi:MAG: hypothetical protein WEB00_05390 [Dehalococcoidia bacterium]